MPISHSPCRRRYIGPLPSCFSLKHPNFQIPLVSDAQRVEYVSEFNCYCWRSLYNITWEYSYNVWGHIIRHTTSGTTSMVNYNYETISGIGVDSSSQYVVFLFLRTFKVPYRNSMFIKQNTCQNWVLVSACSGPNIWCLSKVSIKTKVHNNIHRTLLLSDRTPIPYRFVFCWHFWSQCQLSNEGRMRAEFQKEHNLEREPSSCQDKNHEWNNWN